MNKDKKVLFIRGTKAASGYYRMALPCITLKKLGYTTDIINYDTIDPVKMWGYKKVKGKAIPYDLLKSDIVIFQLIWFEALNIVVRKLKEAKIFTAMETDDNYFHLPRNNPVFWSFHPKAHMEKDANGKRIIRVYQEKINPALDNMIKAMRTVDMLQVSTPELAEIYKPLNDNIVVLENCIDNSLYDAISKVVNPKPVVMWAGSQTHIDDLIIINGCIPENCKLIIGGFPEVEKVELFEDHKNIEFLPKCKLKDYPKMVAKGDICAIPLVDNKFNSCKSDIKGLEFGAMGIPSVTSDVPPYRRWIKHGENGFLVKKNKTKFWIRYLQMLVDDVELRIKLGKQAKESAKERDITKNIYKWEEVYFNE